MSLLGWSTSQDNDQLRLSDGYPPDQSRRPQPDVTCSAMRRIMSPLTGKGANDAMLDALELAACLTSDRFADVAAALAGYEAAMLARMSPAIRKLWPPKDLLILPEAPANLAELFVHRTA